MPWTSAAERGPSVRRWPAAAAVLTLTLWLAAGAQLLAATAPADNASVRYAPRVWGDRPSVQEMTELGRRLFMDPALSASGRQACASCHDPANHFAPSNGLASQPGGADGTHPGSRNAPSLKYLQTTLPFSEHHIDDEETHGDDVGPTGGLTWDGRVDDPRTQALIPLYSPDEMANTGAEDLARRVAAAPYAPDFRRAFSAPGDDVFRHPHQVVGWLAMALQVFQQDPATFYPFTSKYDAVLRGKAELTTTEARGLAVFNDPRRGNCASCHPSGIDGHGAFPMFSDAGYAALSAPRNREIAANADPAFFDLGLCGPVRTDLAAREDLCGHFKVPSLRNVATRHRFFHNGVFHSLREVLDFYATRDTQPERWYPHDSHGRTLRDNDLPAKHHRHIERDAPFGQQPGDQPMLSDRDLRDLESFLATLTDGWQPAAR